MKTHERMKLEYLQTSEILRLGRLAKSGTSEGRANAKEELKKLRTEFLGKATLVNSMLNENDLQDIDVAELRSKIMKTRNRRTGSVMLQIAIVAVMVAWFANHGFGWWSVVFAILGYVAVGMIIYVAMNGSFRRKRKAVRK